MTRTLLLPGPALALFLLSSSLPPGGARPGPSSPPRRADVLLAGRVLAVDGSPAAGVPVTARPIAGGPAVTVVPDEAGRVAVPAASGGERAPGTRLGGTPAADPADVESLDAIVAAVYDVISGPAGERDWERMRSLFVPGARLIVAVPDSAGGAQARVRTLEEYIAANAPYFRENGFFEREIGRRTETFGNVAHVFSTYESRHDAADPRPFTRGINSIQLLRDGDRWWIVTIYWDSERPGNPIPPRTLGREGGPASGSPDAERPDAAGPTAPARACSGDGHERLDFWVGEWEVLDPQGVKVGVNRVRKALGGCAVREEWTDARGGRGSSLFWYSRPDSAWRQVWVTDAGTSKEKREVEAPGPGAVRFQGRVAARDGSSVLDRTTLTRAGGGRVRQLIEVSRDDGRTWSPAFDGLYVPSTGRPPQGD